MNQKSKPAHEEYQDDIIPIVSKIMENFSSIQTQRAMNKLGDTLHQVFGAHSKPRQVSDSWKKHFVSFYYKRRLRNILNLIKENFGILENGLDYKDMPGILEKIEAKLDSKPPYLFMHYYQEDELIQDFHNFIKEKYADSVAEYKEKIRELKKIKSPKQGNKAVAEKPIDENQIKLDFD